VMESHLVLTSVPMPVYGISSAVYTVCIKACMQIAPQIRVSVSVGFVNAVVFLRTRWLAVNSVADNTDSRLLRRQAMHSVYAAVTLAAQPTGLHSCNSCRFFYTSLSTTAAISDTTTSTLCTTLWQLSHSCCMTLYTVIVYNC
jgi:hypothetical protein